MNTVPDLPASVETCHWGAFDATLPPVMSVRRGQRFTVAREAESLSIMPAQHAKRRPPVVANARHSPSYGCALRLDRTSFDALLGHARKTLSL